jgi:hypothetical protein
LFSSPKKKKIGSKKPKKKAKKRWKCQWLITKIITAIETIPIVSALAKKVITVGIEAL